MKLTYREMSSLEATSISLLVAIGVRAAGQKVLLAVKNMGGESEAAWLALFEDLVRRRFRTLELVIVDGAPGPREGAVVQRADPALHRANTAIGWPMRLGGCMRKCPTTTTI